MREKCGLIKRAKHVSLMLKGYVLAREIIVTDKKFRISIKNVMVGGFPLIISQK